MTIPLNRQHLSEPFHKIQNEAIFSFCIRSRITKREPVIPFDSAHQWGGVMDGLNYKKIFSNREFRVWLVDKLSFIPDSLYLKVVYWIKTGRRLNLKKPVGFNEKLNWLKLHNIHEEYAELVDKLAVREYIKKKLGEKHLIPLLGSWEHFSEIDFETLPEKFVLKCSHDSGSVKIITDKKNIDKNELKFFFERRLKVNPYNLGREYPYKKLKPRLIAEKFMESSDGSGLNDYKFFCFDGEPRIMYVATERAVEARFDFFDMDFTHLNIQNIHDNSDKTIAKPRTFEKMKEIARQLSQGMKFVRVDLYEINGEVYFGEFTFFHGGGFYLFHPDEWEQRLGSWLDLSDVTP